MLRGDDVPATDESAGRGRRAAIALPCAALSRGVIGASIIVVCGCLWGGWPGSECSATEPPGEIAFDRDIRGILSDKCWACHGPDAAARQADLRLDRPEDAVADRGGYAAVVPGDVAASLLVDRITTSDPDLRMPPPEFGKELSAAEAERLRAWIAAGAPWESHWSLRPVERSAPPSVTAIGQEWPLGAIDQFILERHGRNGLVPSAEAEPAVLLRRLHLDLVGLPPSPEVVQAFEADPSLASYEAQVDRLLASPAFGERLAMYWLDVVRYADSLGYHGDQERSVSPYRDYVISAFNRGLAFDRFTIEQLAGDLLEEPTLEQRVASTYNRLNRASGEGGGQPQEYLAKYLADRVRTLGGVWLGLTTGCAECHDHKFDDLSIRDFYSLGAFFADIHEQGIVASAVHVAQLPVPTPEQAAELSRLEMLWNQLQEIPAPASAGADRGGAELDATSGAESERLAEQRQQVQAALDQLRRSIVTTLGVETVEPRPIRILPRGDWLDTSGELVEPAIPALFGSWESDTGGRLNRLDLARWLVDSDNPLTARVLANRLWMLFFGAGLSPVVDDLGAQGEPPSHPELLDWLASELQHGDWDLKRLIRQLVTSRTYRQSSSETDDLRRIDPTNRWLARQASFRIDAELVRDQALFASGLLVRQVGGVSARPYQPAGYWDQLNFPKRTYQADVGAQQYRRGLYTHWQRTFLHPALLAFDASHREECTARRERSNTPLQALVLLNDPSFVEAAIQLAGRIEREGGETLEQRLRWGMRTVVGRWPSSLELDLLHDLYRQQLADWQADPAAAAALLGVGQLSPPAGDPVELAALTQVARLLLNLHEAITRY